MTGPHTIGGVLAKFKNCGCSDPRRPLAAEIVRLMTENDELKLQLEMVRDARFTVTQQAVAPV